VTELCLQTLVENHYARIYRAALVMTGSVWDADDLAQETFLQALGGLNRFAANSRVAAGIYVPEFVERVDPNDLTPAEREGVRRVLGAKDETSFQPL
jgi:hypothetical protein